MNKTILITGASSGIGTACVEIAAKLDFTIIATARNKDNLNRLKNSFNNVQIIVADIATETGRTEIIQSIQKPIDFLLHNAAILDQPQKLEELTVEDFRKNMATNVEPLLFLTQELIPKLSNTSQAARILSLSSGAAKQAIAGLGNYCVSKAAALMANQILKVELNKYNILVNDYFPGVVDTSMQKTLRNSTSEIFPYSDEFIKMKKENQLNKPLEVAKHILDIFTNTNDDEFLQSEWTFKPHNVLDKS